MFVDRYTKLKKVYLTDVELETMVDLEDKWMKPPLPYPIWSLDRDEKFIFIYDPERYTTVMEDYWRDRHESNSTK